MLSRCRAGRGLLLVLAALALAGTSLAACSRPGSSSGPPAGAVVVTIRHLRFNPPVVTIKAGQTVAWHFDDEGVGHNVTSVPPSGPLHSGERESGYYSHRFTKPGTYNYECTIHVMDGMVGKVIVG